MSGASLLAICSIQPVHKVMAQNNVYPQPSMTNGDSKERRRNRLLSELAYLQPAAIVSRFQKADEEYKKDVRSAFGTSFSKFTQDYVDELIERDDYKALYRGTSKKSLDCRVEQFQILSEFERGVSNTGYEREFVDSKLADAAFRQRVQSAFGFRSHKFRELYEKYLEQK